MTRWLAAPLLLALLGTLGCGGDGAESTGEAAPTSAEAPPETGDDGGGDPVSGCGLLPAEEANTLLGHPMEGISDAGGCSLTTAGEEVSIAYSVVEGTMAYDMQAEGENVVALEGLGDRAVYVPMLTTVSGMLLVVDGGRTLTVSGATLGREFRPLAEQAARAILPRM